jgi:hypothetical protein
MSALIAALDGGLVVAGEAIKLRRSVGTTNKANIDVDIRAAVRSPTDQELVAGIAQDELFCIFSPTEINNAQWPGGQPPGATEDARIPNKNKGDSAYVRGRWRAVQWGQGFYPGGELCRIEMRVLG